MPIPSLIHILKEQQKNKWKGLSLEEMSAIHKHAIKKQKSRKKHAWGITDRSNAVAEQRLKENIVEPNDNAWINYNYTGFPRKPKNPQLQRKAEEGARKHAAWEKERPIISAWGNVAGAAPFVVAAVPLGAGTIAAGDAVAGSTAGQAMTGLLTTAASSPVGQGVQRIFPWLDATTTSVFGALGIQNAIDEGGMSPMTALEVAPMGRMARPMLNSTIEPLSSVIANSDVGKRTLEVSMQTTPDHIPFRAMREGIGSMLLHGKFGRIKDISKYVFTGKPGRIGYNHLNKNPHRIYTGLGGEQNGYIRSLLYGEHPQGGLKYVGTAEEIPVGEHLSTIRERGYSPRQVRVYETDVPYDYAFDPFMGVWDAEAQAFASPVKRYQPLQGGSLTVSEREIEPLIKSASAEGSFPIGSTGKLYDGQGHRLQYVTDPEGVAFGGIVRGQDFTDFNFRSYGDRWLPGKNGYFYTLGRKVVDKATTPIIVRTPWGYTDDIDSFLNWHRAFDWKHTGKYVPSDKFYTYNNGGLLTRL